MFNLEGISFVKCDFSDCEIGTFRNFPDLREGENWYDESYPPRADKKVDWASLLIARSGNEAKEWRSPIRPA